MRPGTSPGAPFPLSPEDHSRAPACDADCAPVPAPHEASPEARHSCLLRCVAPVGLIDVRWDVVSCPAMNGGTAGSGLRTKAEGVSFAGIAPALRRGRAASQLDGQAAGAAEHGVLPVGGRSRPGGRCRGGRAAAPSPLPPLPYPFVGTAWAGNRRRARRGYGTEITGSHGAPTANSPMEQVSCGHDGGRSSRWPSSLRLSIRRTVIMGGKFHTTYGMARTSGAPPRLPGQPLVQIAPTGKERS